MELANGMLPPTQGHFSEMQMKALAQQIVPRLAVSMGLGFRFRVEGLGLRAKGSFLEFRSGKGTWFRNAE